MYVLSVMGDRDSDSYERVCGSVVVEASSTFPCPSSVDFILAWKCVEAAGEAVKVWSHSLKEGQG